MNTEEVFGHKARLKDLDKEGFPFEAVFLDIKDDTLKQITVTENAWNTTLKTFEDNDNISRNVIFKHLSKNDSVKTQPI